MRKKLIAAGLVLALAGMFCFFCYQKGKVRQTTSEPAAGQEAMCESLLISILTPTVQQEVDRFYGRYLTEPPTVGSAFIEIAAITPHIPDGCDVELIVLPYCGPHNSVGKDKLILHIESNRIDRTEFQHLESYEIFGNDRNKIIEWPPK